MPEWAERVTVRSEDKGEKHLSESFFKRSVLIQKGTMKQWVQIKNAQYSIRNSAVPVCMVPLVCKTFPASFPLAIY